MCHPVQFNVQLLRFLPSLVILEDGSVLVGYRGTKCCCDELIGTWGMCGEHEYESASYLRLVDDLA